MLLPGFEPGSAPFPAKMPEFTEVNSRDAVAQEGEVYCLLRRKLPA